MMDQSSKNKKDPCHIRCAIILCDQHASVINSDQPHAVQKIELSKLHKTIESFPKKAEIYWILLNDGYQILPMKYRFGSGLKLSDDTLQKMAKWSPSNGFKNTVFSFEQLLSINTNCQLNLSTQITRHIEARRFFGVIGSRLSVASPIASTTLNAARTELNASDLTKQLEKKIQATGFGLFQKARWRISLNTLFLAEVFLLLLLTFLTPISFFLKSLPSKQKPIITQAEPLIPKAPPQAPRQWAFSQLSYHLNNLSHLSAPFKNLILQQIEFNAPTLTLSGYWQQSLSKQTTQQEWERLLNILTKSPQIKALQVLRTPLQGNLSQRQSFRLQLQLLNQR